MSNPNRDIIKTLWKIPVPVTGLIRGPDFTNLPGNTCEISFSIEASDGTEEWKTLRFNNVQAYKCTNLYSLSSIDQELRRQSYGTVISIESPWLNELKKSYGGYCASAQVPLQELQHFMITFDDGPCYEFVCAAFAAL